MVAEKLRLVSGYPGNVMPRADWDGLAGNPSANGAVRHTKGLR